MVLWATLSGIFFYMYYDSFDLNALLTILMALTFLVEFVSGVFLTAPTIFCDKLWFYALGAVVAELLNFFYPRWWYPSTELAQIISAKYLVWLMAYIIPSVVSLLVLRLSLGYESTSQDPLDVRSYYLKSAGKNVAEPLRGYIKTVVDNNSVTVKEEKVTWLRFDVGPNSYAVAFVPANTDEFEMDVFGWRRQYDTLSVAEKGAAELFTSVMNALLETWKNQGQIQAWKVETSPRYAQELRNREYARLTTGMYSRLARSLRLMWDRLIGWIRNSFANLVLGAVLAAILEFLLTNAWK